MKYLKYALVVIFVLFPYGMGLITNLASGNPLDAKQALISVLGFGAGIMGIWVMRSRDKKTELSNKPKTEA
ncbi:hypothetical protein [Pseudomonas abietaniphila]|uniref:Uncharacterized protein n=1 Tax=Pseudomonas abietaniphila TaxID=89065 RepID=A0A1G8R357_9PSED|nr:hypothetical protein [Pseudomonas abietaniphila]SDJ11402.1 hypothetical protein SAMN05216605_121150 [Pseudomonas abietaniphila]